MIGWIVFIIFFLGMFYLLLLLNNKRNRRKLLKNYDDTKDLSRQGEARRFGAPEHLVKGSVELKRSSLLPSTDANSVRKDSRSSRNIFKKLQRR